MTTRVGYKPSYEWVQSLLRPLRIPLVFMLSGLASFCAFQDGNALVGGSGAASRNMISLALWDADLMPRGDRLAVREPMSGGFAKAVSPDVLVVYDVPRFDQLLKLRNALGLYGYTAVMSNFFCGKAPKGAQWPFEIAVLSRYPISQAVQYNPPGRGPTSCRQSAPATDGPVVATRAALATLAKLDWPSARDGHAIAGPGLLSVRIDSTNTSVIAVRVPAASEYPGADPASVARMRVTFANAAHQWMVAERGREADNHVFAVGDFGFGPDVSSVPSERVARQTNESGDSIDRIMLGHETAQGTPDDGAISLTHHLFEEGLSPGVFPHSDRIFLLRNGPLAFGPARRVNNSFGSRAFPLVVSSSGAGCTADPGLQFRRRSPVFQGITHQYFSASALAYAQQLRALRGGTGKPAKWAVSIDLDDVLLDNSPLLYRLALQCKQPTRADWQQWIESGQAKLTAGARSFLLNLRARAVTEGGRIVLTTDLPPDLRDVIVKELIQLGVMTGTADGIVQVMVAPDATARDARWHEITSGGARLVLVLGGRVDQFPDDPRLPVGGSDRSCRNDGPSSGDGRSIFGSQTARFGVCYFLLPVHVL